ncbi:MAG: glycosyltransferase [bacterium]|nr:glycosyltransferase [bacterium]
MKKHAVSIIVPTWNEESNVVALIERIDAAMKKDSTVYEIVFVDDRSTDDTQKKIRSMLSQYPIRLLVKPETIERGKAQSLMLGFAESDYELLAMIDADLQYPPEALSNMIQKINDGADIVVADRVDEKTTFMRRFTHWGFKFFFAEFLHGLHCDVQSGLKVFKKEIIERVAIKPSRWTFDLEFLTKARDAGYIIESVGIIFNEREAGATKINVLRATYEIGINALKLKLTGPSVIPLHPRDIEKEGQGYHYKGKKYVHHTKLSHTESAIITLTLKQKLILITLLTLTVITFILNWHTALIVFVAVLTILYFADLLFNFYLIMRSMTKSPELQVSQEEIDAVPSSEWPRYTIFCPLYKEWEVLPQFVSAMSSMDYPKDRLQVMLLLEENDPETIQKAREFNLPSYFDIVVVPHSLPKTKPKACNYGLLKTTGEYVVIYDAEDVPDVQQLKKAYIAFKTLPETVKCVQAKLNYYNPHQNLLTRFFTSEYSLWFDLTLPGLQSMQALIPLGGTSNHFRLEDLRIMNGWDAFNVTEDCDLGIRLAKRGYTTAVIDSTTLEEANSDYVNWLWQRSRWIKGYIQSYFVHMRNPRSFIRDKKVVHLISLQTIVGGKILSLFINPFMWAITIVYFILRAQVGLFIESLFPSVVFYMAIFCLIGGNFLYIYYYMIACAKREHYSLIIYSLAIPFYWLSMSMAAWLAVYKLITAPHHWAKTKHGLHLKNSKSAEQSSINVGRALVEEGLVGVSAQ